MADHDDIWSPAIQEAYASAPPAEVLLDTLELRHPSWDIAVRVVRDHGAAQTIEGETRYGHMLTVETDAPADAGAAVFFQACMFGLQLPEQSDRALPQVEVSIDNATSELTPYLDLAIADASPVALTYRQYLASDPATPQFVLNGLTMGNVRVTAHRAVGVARFGEFINREFPGRVYRPADFPGLLQ